MPISFRQNRTSSSRPASVVGKIFLSLFLLPFLAFGLFFAGWMLKDIAQKAATWRWPAGQCSLLESGVAEDPGSDGKYLFTVRYAYDAAGGGDVEGSRRAGAVYARGYAGSDDYDEARRLADLYPPPSPPTRCTRSPRRTTRSSGPWPCTATSGLGRT